MTRKTLALLLAVLALLGVPVALEALAGPDDQPAARDDALDDLLKKTGDDESKPPAKAETTPDPKGDAKPGGDVAPKDKDLDNFLENLGATHDKPTPEERKPGMPGAGQNEPKPDPGQEKKSKAGEPPPLKGKDKDLDEHLEEAAGKRKRRQQGEANGPLAQVIKEMREVEERLGKPDTGDETRKKQAEIVKKMQTLIDQARTQQAQSTSKKKSMANAKGKQQPNQPKNEQAGTTGGNAPFTKPEKPTDRRSLAGGKELWGDLPPEVRQDLDNVMKEGFLPSREELIRKYYLSLSKKKAIRGESTP